MDLQEHMDAEIKRNKERVERQVIYALRYHFYELVDNVERLDSELLKSFVLQHSSGLHLLAGPDLSEPHGDISARALGETIDFIRSRYEFVLLDCPPEPK